MPLGAKAQGKRGGLGVSVRRVAELRPKDHTDGNEQPRGQRHAETWTTEQDSKETHALGDAVNRHLWWNDPTALTLGLIPPRRIVGKGVEHGE